MYFITTKRMLEVCFSAHPNIQYRTFLYYFSLYLKQHLQHCGFEGTGGFGGHGGFWRVRRFWGYDGGFGGRWWHHRPQPFSLPWIKGPRTQETTSRNTSFPKGIAKPEESLHSRCQHSCNHYWNYDSCCYFFHFRYCTHSPYGCRYYQKIWDCSCIIPPFIDVDGR